MDKSRKRFYVKILILKLLAYNFTALFLGYERIFKMINFPEFLSSIAILFIYIQEIKCIRNKLEMILSVIAVTILGVLVDLQFIAMSVMIILGYYINNLSILNHERSVFVINISYYSLSRAANNKYPKATKLDVYFTLLTILIIFILAHIDYNLLELKYIPVLPYADWYPI